MNLIDKHLRFLFANLLLLIIQGNQSKYKNLPLLISLIILITLQILIKLLLQFLKVRVKIFHTAFIIGFITFLEIQQTLAAIYIFNDNIETAVLYMLALPNAFMNDMQNQNFAIYHFLLSIFSTTILILVRVQPFYDSMYVVAFVLFYFMNYFNLYQNLKRNLTTHKLPELNINFKSENSEEFFQMEKVPLKLASSKKLVSMISNQLSSVQSQKHLIDEPRSKERFGSEQHLSFSNIKAKLKKSLSRQERELLQVGIWQERINQFPIGIGILKKQSKKFSFMNIHLINLLQKFQDFSDQSEQEELLLNELNFQIVYKLKKRLNSFRLSETESSRQIRSQKMKSPTLDNICKNVIKKYEILEDEKSKSWKLNQLIDYYLCGNLNQHLNPFNKSLDLQCAYKDDEKQIHIIIALTILSSDSINDALTIIVKDITKHNELLDIEIKEKFKSKVINSFSHELRTPLNGAQLYLLSCMSEVSEIVRNTYLLPATIALKMQSYLINDIVDFCALSEQIFELKLCMIEIKDIVEEINSLFLANFKTKNIGFIIDVDERMPEKIKIDFQRVCQIIVNIVQNSLKFSSKGVVQLKIQKVDDHLIQFILKDEGIGIEKQRLNQLKNTLAASNLADHIGNIENWNGFGLIISQMILLNLSPELDQKLEIFSQGFQKGTQVKFTIQNYPSSSESLRWLKNHFGLRDKKREFSAPIKQGLHKLHSLTSQLSRKQQLILQSKQGSFHSDSIVEDIDGKVYNYNIKIDQQSIFRMMKPSIIINTINNLNSKQIDLMKKSENCKCKRILSVDDEVFNQHSLEILFKQIKFEVLLVREYSLLYLFKSYNGQDALNLFLNDSIRKCGSGCIRLSAILMDCQMPIMDGWETTAKLKMMMENQQIPYIPIIGLTAFTTKSDIERCLMAGMDHILHKPLKMKELKLLLGI